MSDCLIGEPKKDWHPPHIAEYLPAIPYPLEREPDWYVLRYVAGQEKLLLWMLDWIKLPYKYLYFIRKSKHKRAVRKSWLPGYLFVEIDIARDRWQQVLRMPHVLEYLGSPTPIPMAHLNDLIRKCPERIGRPTAIASVSPGTTVRVLRGPLAGQKAVVIWSDRKTVKIPYLMFGNPDTDVTLRAADVEVVVD